MTYIEQRLETLERLVVTLQERIDELENSVFPERRLEQAPVLISMAEAARLAGKHRNTIVAWVKDGRLTVVERQGREALVRRDDVLAIIEAKP
jgi:excisionase family DNA binding protein